MKKTIALILVLAICLSLCACGGSSTPETEVPTEITVPPITTLTKDEMLQTAVPLSRDDVDKSISNIAFAKSLIGNVYTFSGDVYTVTEDHAVITFWINDEEGVYGTVLNVMVGNLYLPLEELVALENTQKLSFVGRLDDVNAVEQNGYYGTETVVEMIFESVAIVSDRFQRTGKLDSPNSSYGDNSWNIKFPNSNYLGLVYFAEDVSAYQGQEITYSYKSVNGKNVDARIVE